MKHVRCIDGIRVYCLCSESRIPAKFECNNCEQTFVRPYHLHPYFCSRECCMEYGRDHDWDMSALAVNCEGAEWGALHDEHFRTCAHPEAYCWCEEV